MDERMTPGEAWGGFVGSQTPQEFMEISRQKGFTTVEEACGVYAADVPAIFGADAQVPENLAELLTEYVRRCVSVCAYCDQIVTHSGSPVPAVDDHDTWAKYAKLHADGCEWVRTWAYQMGHIADCLALALNDYEGDNAWEDVIRAEYSAYLDEPAIAEADPSGMSDTVVLIDGTRVVYDEPAKTWRVR
mgnify:CR=1 FL=1